MTESERSQLSNTHGQLTTAALTNSNNNTPLGGKIGQNVQNPQNLNHLKNEPIILDPLEQQQTWASAGAGVHNYNTADNSNMVPINANYQMMQAFHMGDIIEEVMDEGSSVHLLPNDGNNIATSNFASGKPMGAPLSSNR